MPNVPMTNVNAYYSNTSPGNTILSNVIDAAIQDIVQAINDNWAIYESFVTNVTLPIPDQSIVERHIRNLAITNPKLAPSAVTNDKIADSTITAAKLADLLITTAKLADLSVTNGKLVASAVTGDKIANSTITTDKLQDLLITTAKLAEQSVTEPKLGTSSVSSRALAPQSVQARHIDQSILNPITDAGIQVKFGLIDEQLADIESRLAIDIRAFDFGILPGEIVDEEKLAAFFMHCNENNGRAVFDSGTYYYTGWNYQVPKYGILGQGRRQTVFSLPEHDASGFAFTYGEFNNWFGVLGDVEGIYFSSPDNSSGNIMKITTPSRNFKISSCGFRVGKGDGISLEQTYYMHLSDCVFEGPYNGNLPTSLSDMLVGTGIRSLGTAATAFNNGITITKCDFRYLSQVWRSASDGFHGSNAMLMVGCFFEQIGDCVFHTQGFRFHFDSCYAEALDRNRNVTGRPNQSNNVFWFGGGGPSIFTNCLIDLSGARSNSYMLEHYVGILTFNGGSVGKPENYVTVSPITYSSRGTVVDNGCVGLGQNLPYWEHRYQQNINKYPYFAGEELYANMVSEAKYAKNTLHHQSLPLGSAFGFQPVQPIVSVEGLSDTSTHLVEIDATIYRYIVSNGTFAWKNIIIRFLIDPTMPATIVPTIQEVSSGGNQGAGFSDANFLTKIEAFRRTAARSDMNSPYYWHYQVAIMNENNGVEKVLGNKVKTNIIWLAKGARDTKHPTYGIYPQSHVSGDSKPS
ncbi:hypothetical protein R50345_06100 [Paenibacillus sp. FSL R5-0345]|uniref:hypothetical protein n=1 Tax=Paenibacillus sp. FSL R5-0345 TaxID=1536770 RepID=UPI0004F66FD6|nr:hypothetical protein [Paenibacillus sp. FSL R5-0345]AIQ34227.1 hypothetical protein R50345_06100 [Paenibacillus sp. FSL R5-0345]